MRAGDAVVAEIRDLRAGFHTKQGYLYALNGVGYTVLEGRVTAVVGETGSGKTLSALSIPRLLPNGLDIVSGEVLFRGENVLSMSKRRLRTFRGSRVTVAFQDPRGAINPVFTVGEQLQRVVRLHDRFSRSDARAAALEVLERMQIRDPRSVLRRYPHQLSGGMAQRVMIALAVVHRPELLILDEPTTGLDVTVQAEIIAIIRQLVDDLGLTVLLISHDLGVVAALSDDVVVMYAGHVMETGSTNEVLSRPANPYTQELIRATQSVEGVSQVLHSIPGTVADLHQLPGGCIFADRCRMSTDSCQTAPELASVTDTHRSRCHFSQESSSIAQEPRSGA